ncbi:MAG: sugar phosphate isomerase/epimerase [Chloroflexi bacterium]|nr:sugar phosphate isomerase/epimerase [Chloroflexota bacterium]
MPTLSQDISLTVSTGSLWPMTTSESIHILQELTLSDVELTPQMDEFRLTFERELQLPLYSDLVSIVESGDLTVHSMHAPHLNAEHGHSLRIRGEYLAHSLRICRLLGGSTLVVHPFHLFKSYELTLDYLSGTTRDVWDVLLPDMRALFEQARADNVVISVENVKIWQDDDEHFFNEPVKAKRFIDDVAHPNLGFTLDVIHAQLGGCLDEFLETLAHSIINIHLADLVPPMRRVPPGEGILVWEKLVPTLKQLPNLRQITIELTRAAPAEIARTVDAVLGYWNEFD